MSRVWLLVAAVCLVAIPAAPATAQPPPSPSPPTPPVPGTPTPLPWVPSPIPNPDLPDLPKDPNAPVEEIRDELAEQSREKVPAPATDGPAAPPTDVIWWDVGYRYPGNYNTTRLLSLIERLEESGLGRKRRLRAAAPFIVGGFARFWDSWGEVRHADSGLRPHLGQDVFCDYGVPVLASEKGTLEYGQDPTGGLVARVHRGNGSYWYYAHLSRFEPKRTSGEEVEPGDVIGYCGTSGNAAGTPPHVHFGFFVDHVAQNPMGALIGWLNEAESRATRVLEKLKRRERQVDTAAKPPVEEILATLPPKQCYTRTDEPPELALLLPL